MSMMINFAAILGLLDILLVIGLVVAPLRAYLVDKQLSPIAWVVFLLQLLVGAPLLALAGGILYMQGWRSNAILTLAAVLLHIPIIFGLFQVPILRAINLNYSAFNWLQFVILGFANALLLSQLWRVDPVMTFMYVLLNLLAIGSVIKQMVMARTRTS